MLPGLAICEKITLLHHADMSFSRYDQMFLGFITDTSRKVTESALDSAVGEVVDIETENFEDSIVTWTTRVVK